MAGSAMLQMFRRMLAAFEECYLSDHPFDFKKSPCRHGMCFWFKMYYGYGSEDSMTDVLKKDLEIQIAKADLYYYPTLSMCLDKELSIKPRIAHLKRTIARLEK